MVATRETEPLPMLEAEIDHLVRVLFGMETEILGQVGRTGPLGL